MRNTCRIILVKEQTLKGNITNEKSEKQRALVLQGGGALGAYEVGVLKVLCRKLIEGTKNEQKNEPLFHIVAGTSIGAMNVAGTCK